MGQHLRSGHPVKAASVSFAAETNGGAVLESLQTVPPRRVTLPVQNIEEGLLPNELAVRFMVGGKQFVTFVPAELVDRETLALVAYVVGQWEDGTLLVQLPSDTVTGGSKLRVPASLVTSHDPQ